MSRKFGGDWTGFGLRIDKEDGVLTSNPVLDGGVGGTHGPRTDEGLLERERVRRAELSTIVAKAGGESGGVASVDELLIVLRYIPLGLLGAYSRLIDAGVGERALGSGRGYDDLFESGVGKRSGPRVKTSSAETSIGKGGKREGKAPSFIRSENALAYRSKVDRKLRKLTREMMQYLASPDDAVASVQRRCGGSCKRMGDGEWLYCPWCAGPMEETRNGEAKK